MSGISLIKTDLLQSYPMHRMWFIYVWVVVSIISKTIIMFFLQLLWLPFQQLLSTWMKESKILWVWWKVSLVQRSITTQLVWEPGNTFTSQPIAYSYSVIWCRVIWYFLFAGKPGPGGSNSEDICREREHCSSRKGMLASYPGVLTQQHLGMRLGVHMCSCLVSQLVIERKW